MAALVVIATLAWLSTTVAPAFAQTRAAAATDIAAPTATVARSPGAAPLNEVAVAANAFVRGGPLPAWADLAPVPPARATRRALAIRLDETQLFVADTPVQLVQTVQQANDPAMLGQIGQISLQFIPQYQRLTIYRIAILRAGQVIDHTLDAPVRFLQREAGLEQGIYSGAITASLLLPDVRVGDTLQLQYAITGANPIFAGKYGEGVGWQRQQPIEMRRVTLISPVSRQVRWHWVSDGEPPATVPEIGTERGMRRMRFEARDLPGVDPEPMLPRGATPLAWLEFTEFTDWGEVARWADALFQSDNGLPAELRPWVERWSSQPALEIGSGLTGLAVGPDADPVLLGVARRKLAPSAFADRGAAQPLWRLQGQDAAADAHPAGARHPVACRAGVVERPAAAGVDGGLADRLRPCRRAGPHRRP